LEPIKEFLENHRNIAKIFPEPRFESESEKPLDKRHLLAKQFFFDDTFDHKSISQHLFEHLEENLGFLQEEIQNKKSLPRILRDPKEYINLIGQIEIAVLFKKMGFDIELEPAVPGTIKKSDIKIVRGEFTAYIEVRTLHDREGTLISKSEYVKISTIKNHSLPTIKEIITKKSQQLSEHHPGILVINLDQISRSSHFEGGFYEISKECPIVSAMLIYRHYFNNEGCRVFIDYFANPYARKPVPETIIRLFETGGMRISTWNERDIALVEEMNESTQ
jgi:hypothetical protein